VLDRDKGGGGDLNCFLLFLLNRGSDEAFVDKVCNVSK
jgi:hypothetical protein